MTKKVQAELWNKMVFDLASTDLRCQTPKMEKADKQYTLMCERFEKMLDTEQYSAFQDLIEAAEEINRNSYEMGVGTGLLIAKEIKTFLDNPEEALLLASE